MVKTDHSQAAEKSLDELKSIRTASEAPFAAGMSQRSTRLLILLLANRAPDLLTCSPRIGTEGELRQSFYHRVWDQEYQIHKHRYRLSVAFDPRGGPASV